MSVAESYLLEQGERITSLSAFYASRQLKSPGDLIAIRIAGNQFYAFFLGARANFFEGANERVSSIQFRGVMGDLEVSMEAGWDYDNGVWHHHNGTVADRYSVGQKELNAGIFSVHGERLQKWVIREQDIHGHVPDALRKRYADFLRRIT